MPHTKMRGHNSSPEKPTMFCDELNTAVTFFHQLSKIAMMDKLKTVDGKARVNKTSTLKTRIKGSIANAFLAVIWHALFGSGLRAEDHKTRLADRIEKHDPELEPHAKVLLKIGHFHFNDPDMDHPLGQAGEESITLLHTEQLKNRTPRGTRSGER